MALGKIARSQWLKRKFSSNKVLIFPMDVRLTLIDLFSLKDFNIHMGAATVNY
jgi:hypothetical protein